MVDLLTLVKKEHREHAPKGSHRKAGKHGTVGVEGGEDETTHRDTRDAVAAAVARHHAGVTPEAYMSALQGGRVGKNLAVAPSDAGRVSRLLLSPRPASSVARDG